MKRFCCLFLSIWFLCCGMGIGAHGAAQENDAFVPVLRFVAASDTHVRDDNDLTTQRIGTMMDITYRMAAQDSAYSAVDAVLIAGDLTHDGTQTEFNKFQSAIQAALHPETRFLGIVAKNHDGYKMSRTQVRDTIAQITGCDADFHVTINGYHFIGISVSPHKTEHYDKEQLDWLKQELDSATAADKNRPVFVMHHEHVKDTVYGSSSFEKWYVTHFNQILEQYPQVVDFSGHSHYPLNHPNSVWQGAFTAIGTGAVYYTDYTVDDLRDFSKADENRQVSNFWIVEMDAANRMRLRGIDLPAGKVLCEYILDNPADENNRAFSPENKAAASTPPRFSETATPQVTTGKGTCTVSVPTAASTDGMPVVLYRAFAIDSEGNTVVNVWALPQYFIADPPDTVTLQFNGLSKGDYTIRVVAETAYGVQSEALQTSVSIDSPGAFVAFWVRTALWVNYQLYVFIHSF